jgi:hypothetical protein
MADHIQVGDGRGSLLRHEWQAMIISQALKLTHFLLRDVEHHFNDTTSRFELRTILMTLEVQEQTETPWIETMEVVFTLEGKTRQWLVLNTTDRRHEKITHRVDTLMDYLEAGEQVHT